MSWEDEQTQLLERAKERMRIFSEKTPAERFAWLVKQGLIDRNGNLTKRCGGDADPETEV